MSVVIYKIINTIDNNFYIGSSKNFKKRENRHINSLKNNVHHSIYLQRAFNKYGIENFKIEIIDNCEDNDRIEKEQFYIDNLKPKYNCRKIVGKIDLLHSTFTLEEMYGKEKAEIIKQKQSISKKGKSQSKEHINNRSNSKKILYEVIDHNNKQNYKIKGFYTLAETLNIPWNRIHYALKMKNGYLKNLNITVNKLENLQ